MKKVYINKRPLKKIMAKHMSVGKKPEYETSENTNAKIHEKVSNPEEKSVEIKIDDDKQQQELALEEKKPTKKPKKTADKKEEYNKITEE